MEFLAVVEARSFSSAARKLGVSVACISRQVAALEARLGAKLLIRTTRNVNLTAAGDCLARECRPLIEELSRAQDNVLLESESLEGLVRVSMGGHFAEQQVVAAVTEFCTAYPRIRVEVDISNRTVDLLEGYFDFALRTGPLENSPELIARPLANVPMVTLATPELIEQLEQETGTPLSPLTLPSRRCLSWSGWPWHFRRKERTHTIEPAGRFWSNSAYALIVAAAAEIGVVHVPAYYLRDACRTQHLVQAFDGWQADDMFDVKIVYARNRFMPSRVRLLIDHLLSSRLWRSA